MESHGKRGGAAAEESCCLVVLSEVKKQLRLTAPLAVGCLLQKIIFTISLMFVGRLGEVALASAAMATSFATVSGFSVLIGLSGCLDTLCGQAFGARQHHLLGVYKQRAMLVLTLVSVPVSVIWAYTGEILVLFRQDPEIAAGAGSYMRCMIPSLFLFGLAQCQVMFLQPQNIVLPVMLSAGATAAVHAAACWVLAFKLGMGANGTALGYAASSLFNLCSLALYVRLSPSCKATWAGFSVEAFRDIPAFLKLAVPSALMICIDWWSFELLMLLSGLLPNPKLETAVLSICLNTYSIAFMIPLGLGFAVSIRVSNELGAGRPKAARLATLVVILLAFSLGVGEGLLMVLLRRVLGYAYSNVKEVASYTARLMPILAVSTLFDSIQCVLSGVLRGCGQQKIGAFVNLAANLAGVPAASIFAFICHLRGMGFWFGILCSRAVQTLLLLSITLRTDWKKEALKAKDRVFSSSQPVQLTAKGSAGKDEAQETTVAGKGSVDPEREG